MSTCLGVGLVAVMAVVGGGRGEGEGGGAETAGWRSIFLVASICPFKDSSCLDYKTHQVTDSYTVISELEDR